ncbi:MAG: MFS transporter [Chloroflexota bacterium]
MQDKTYGKARTEGKKPRYFYGWNIVAATFLANLSYAEHQSSMLGLFFKPLQNEFGWSRTALSLTQTISRFAEALFAPVVGPFIDKYGPRVLMPIGAVIVGLAMLGVTQISAIWQFYLLRGIIVAIGFTLMGNLVTDIAINNWFIRKRGRALGIGRLGVNISGIILTPVAVWVIAGYGWRPMFVIFAVIAWLVGFIPAIILMRRRPEDVGLYPDGILPVTTEAQNQRQGKPINKEVTLAPEPIWSRREVLVSGSFWLLALCFGIDNLVFQGINISLAPYIQDLGYSDATLSVVLIFRMAIMAALMPFMGFVAEYAHRTAVRVAPVIIQGVAAFLFLLAGQPVFLWLAVAAYALGVAGFALMQEVIWADYFGRLSLGVVRSLGYLIAFGFAAIGPVAMNVVFDVSGSYRPAFTAAIGLFAVAALAIATVPRPKAKRYATSAGITRS